MKRGKKRGKREIRQKNEENGAAGRWRMGGGITWADDVSK
jgi:hypothetical protein